MTTSQSRPQVTQALRRPARTAHLVMVALAMTAGMTLQAHAQNLVNGGFESGDLSAWTLGGSLDFTGVQCTGPGTTVKEGNCSAFLGAAGALGTLSQSFSTATGGSYTLQFSALFDGGSPSSFSAFVNGVKMLDLTDAYSATYQTFVIPFKATGAVSSISFSFRDDPGLTFLDAVAVVPEPSSAWLIAVGLSGIALRRFRPLRFWNPARD